MTRYLKALGLAIGAMLALGALSAASASAQSVLTTETPVTLTGEEIDPEQNTLHMFGSEFDCDSFLTGHKYTTHSETTHEETTNEEHNTLIPNEANTITITPHYTNCEGGQQVDMNGCDFVLHIGDTTGGGETYGVSTDIVCPEGATIAITGGACTVTLPPQNGLSGPHLGNTPGTEGTPHDVHLSGTFTNIQASACHFLNTSEATLVVDMTIKADDADGLSTGVTISHD